MNLRIVAVLIALMGWTVCARASDYANSVLDLGVGAAALGMGGAYVAVADDSTATYWNPAGLTAIDHIEAELVEQGQGNAVLNDGTNEVGSEYIYVSGGLTLPDIGSFGVAVMRFGVAGIPQIPNSTNPAYTCSTCPPPPQIGTFGTQDVAVFASYAKQLHPSLDLGVSAKLLTGGTTGLQADPSNGITGNYSYDYYGLDAGVLFKPGVLLPSLAGLNLGLNLQDVLNSGVQWNIPGSAKEAVFVNAKSGLSYSPPFAFLTENWIVATLAVDLDPQPSLLIHYGAEVWYRDTLALRAGLRQYTDARQGDEWSYGAGFKIYVLEVDYAYIDYDLTPIQYLSMQMSF